jgi:acyl carrier protein
MITPEAVEAKLIEVAARVFKKPAGDISSTSRFKEDLGADSLDVTVALFEFEDAFNLTIPDAEVLKMKTVGDVVRYVVQVTKT